MASRRGPDNSCRVSISGTMNSQPWANVFYVQLATSSSITQADLDTWTTAFANAYKTAFQARQLAAVSYQLARAVLFTPGGGELISLSTMTGAGSNAGSAVADNACCVVGSWLSSVYWRGGKPRTYLPGVPSGDVVNATTLAAGSITNWTTACTGFRTSVNGLTAGTITGTTHGFVSFRSGNVERTPPVFFPSTGARVHARLGTQRRRLGRWLP